MAAEGSGKALERTKVTSRTKKKLEGEGDSLDKRNLIKARPIIKPANMKSESSPDEIKRLRDIKIAVKRLESDNTNKIIVFDSGKPWYKIAFRSNLIYKNRVLPYLEREYFHPRDDKDGYAFSQYGVTGIIDVVAFGDTLVQLGAKPPKELKKYYDGTMPEDARLPDDERKKLFVFQFRGMTLADIETYVEAEAKETESLNELVLAAYNPQELYNDLHRLSATTVDILRRLPSEIRDTIGYKLMDNAIMMLTCVNVSCNGYGGKQDMDFIKALNYCIYLCAEIQEIIRSIEDARVIRPGACHLLVKLSILVQRDANSELRKLKVEGNPTVRAIKNLKNFPQKEGVVLSNIIPDKKPSKGFIQARFPFYGDAQPSSD